MSQSVHHKIWQIAWPAILSNISTPLLGLVDTALLGHLDSTRYLAAVAIGASILSFLYWGFGFLRMGTTGTVARAAGAGDSGTELTVVLQSALLALLLAALVIASRFAWLPLGLYLMAPPQALAALAADYVAIRVYSAPAVLLTYTITGWFIGRQNTRWPMLIMIATNLLNIVLDVLFIVVLDGRSAGAAWATLLAEYAGCGLAVYLAWRKLDWAPLPAVRQRLRNLSAYGGLLRNNQYLFIRTVCLLFAFAFFTAMSTRLGETTLAANTIMLNLLMFAAFGLDGFAYAAEGLAGNAAGAGDLARFRGAVRACWTWSLATAGLLSVFFFGTGHVIYPVFTDHADVLAMIERHQLWLVMLPLLSAPSYLLDGVFIGTARSRYMMQGMLISLLLVYLPCWYFTRTLGNHGLWLAFTAFNAARGLTLWVYFRRLNRHGGWLD
ncbi:MAG: MATE family efflux transporter [Halieaceae bacterium]|jgi:MATE family multidrug resistance protein|nr:MATE family efflux transporter [Halieaceae bacterium]